jgi:dihydroneopterin aldolase
VITDFLSCAGVIVGAARCSAGAPERKGGDASRLTGLLPETFPLDAHLLLPAQPRERAVKLDDRLQLEVHDLEVQVLTGIYSEETHLPQPLRISLTVDLECPTRFEPDTPLHASKNYLDLKRAATDALPPGVHFTLIEGVADHIAETLLLQDERVRRVQVKIVKMAIAEADESIGITLVRHRR